MPNTRRRRFSVQNEIRGRDPPKLQNGTQVSQQESDPDIKVITQNLLNTKSMKVKNKIFPSTSKHSSPLEIVTECESFASMKKYSTHTSDKDITASSSNIDFYDILTNRNNDATDNQLKDVIEVNDFEISRRRDARLVQRDRTPRRDKHPHRIKVRSPKRKVSTIDRVTRRSFGINTLDQEQQEQMQNEIEKLSSTSVEEPSVQDNDTIEVIEQEIPATPSLEDMCRICHGGEALSPEFGQMISACSCRGTVGRVHVKCLERWLTESGKSRCELCGTRYATRRVHRYGVLKAFVMWALSQNAKQLMVDSLGIMLMSPLAVLAAWLSGRTLAGLMTQETHITPWPLASTFVLACMTLVCYYCWIVSAATRHALAWWIWYRSQYEVRLQLQEE